MKDMSDQSDHCILNMMDFESWPLDDEFQEDFIQDLSSKLDIPLLLGGEGSPIYDESPDDIMKNATESPSSYHTDDLDMNFMPMDLDVFQNICSDGLDPLSSESDFLNEITEGIKIEKNIKMEPQSPRSSLPLSPSPSHSESSGLEWHNDASSTTSSDGKFMLETPPISPPQSEPTSPPKLLNSASLQQIKLYPVNAEENSAAKFVLSKGCTAKRVCIQPRINKTSAKGGEQPRKTIILSAQDFAALSQKVKQNGTPQLKIQTLPINRTVKVQNQLNILPTQHAKVEKGTSTAFAQTNQLKLINSIPKVQIPSANTIATPIVVPKEPPPAACTPLVLKDNPNCTPIVIKNEISEYINLSGRQESEIKALKRQQRMIKNRESACLSRKKKKEYVTALENQISDLQERNQQLQAENAALKQRLSEVEELNGGRSRGRNVNLGANRKNTVMLLAVLCMVSFNFSNFGVFQTKPKIESMSAHMPLPNVRRTRSLLWTEPDPEDTNSSTESFNETMHHPMCPMFINQTESIRLDYELRRWIGGNSDEDNWTKPTKTELEVKSLGEFLLSKPSFVQKKIMDRLKPPTKKKLEPRQRSTNVPSQNNNAVEVFSPTLKDHAELFDALRRKDDTFYVVWFSGEHLLLPASRQNNTVRPKMSLVFPALPVNETLSAPPNHVTMMQIDCEVTNTQLLHLKNSVIPEHLRNQRKPSRSAKARGENYKPYFLKENDTRPFNQKNFEEPYILRGKGDFIQKETPYIMKDKFDSGFDLDDEKYDPYNVESKSVLKSEQLVSGGDNFYEDKSKERSP
ncbi:cyclic AMP-dependent transcription factor ATF-6 alpha isoform X2 [Belonocnema kinseyi]|uniref:cyclic AMP-dependent transcription factor ATF-6 alpha isoform X2 n=1 Tax=Belonocnema kinseyi TaxID=2817044 RepID=UPI00143D374F|nr:cyclic AMP-dependent transcription factor ATF-6 alpha isoform X2 [Belonocnema kinseyi]